MTLLITFIAEGGIDPLERAGTAPSHMNRTRSNSLASA
jgi:hypothetical protein